MRVDVFKEDERGLDLFDDARDVRPEVARILRAPLFAGDRKGLARVAACEDVGLTAIRSPVECNNVAPNVRSSEGSVFKARRQDAGCSNFPFDEHERASRSESKVKSESETAVSGAQFDNRWRYSHIHAGPRSSPGDRRMVRS